jgi:hypothetical protein
VGGVLQRKEHQRSTGGHRRINSTSSGTQFVKNISKAISLAEEVKPLQPPYEMPLRRLAPLLVRPRVKFRPVVGLAYRAQVNVPSIDLTPAHPAELQNCSTFASLVDADSCVAGR